MLFNSIFSNKISIIFAFCAANDGDNLKSLIIIHEAHFLNAIVTGFDKHKSETNFATE